MARLMSVTLTEQAVVERRKTVTRRLGWLMLKPGDELDLCRKVMGRRKGDPLVRLARVRVTDVERVCLTCGMSEYEAALEGFPGMSGDEFVAFFTEHMRVDPHAVVTRIEWSYVA